MDVIRVDLNNPESVRKLIDTYGNVKNKLFIGMNESKEDIFTEIWEDRVVQIVESKTHYTINSYLYNGDKLVEYVDKAVNI